MNTRTLFATALGLTVAFGGLSQAFAQGAIPPVVAPAVSVSPVAVESAKAAAAASVAPVRETAKVSSLKRAGHRIDRHQHRLAQARVTHKVGGTPHREG